MGFFHCVTAFISSGSILASDSVARILEWWLEEKKKTEEKLRNTRLKYEQLKTVLHSERHPSSRHRFDLKVWTEDVGNVALLKMFFLQSLQRHQRWLHLNKILRAGFYYTFALTITSESPDDMTCLCTSHLAFSSALLSLLVSCCFYYPLCQERNNKNNHDALSAGSPITKNSKYGWRYI